MESFYSGPKGTSFILVKNYPSIAAMEEEFSKGAETTNEVGYGEYVIINTVDINNADNGKIFRRDFNGPSEMIAKIVGPKGDAPELEIVDYDDFEGEVTEGIIKTVAPDKTADSPVKYKLATVKDDNGNIIGAKIGLEVPYFDLNASAVTVPYTESASIQRDVHHNAFQHWILNIPQGVPGRSVTAIRNINTGFTNKHYYDKVTLEDLGVLREGYIEEDLPIECLDGHYYATVWYINKEYYINYDEEVAGNAYDNDADYGRYVFYSDENSNIEPLGTEQRVIDIAVIDNNAYVSTKAKLYDVVAKQIGFRGVGSIDVNGEDGWYVIGNIQPAVKGVQIMHHFNTLAEFNAAVGIGTGTQLTPEELAAKIGAKGPAAAYAGWMVTVTDGEQTFIYAYDYVLGEWYQATELGGGGGGGVSDLSQIIGVLTSSMTPAEAEDAYAQVLPNGLIIDDRKATIIQRVIKEV